MPSVFIHILHGASLVIGFLELSGKEIFRGSCCAFQLGAASSFLLFSSLTCSEARETPRKIVRCRISDALVQDFKIIWHRALRLVDSLFFNLQDFKIPGYHLRDLLKFWCHQNHLAIFFGGSFNFDQKIQNCRPSKPPIHSKTQTNF